MPRHSQKTSIVSVHVEKYIKALNKIHEYEAINPESILENIKSAVWEAANERSMIASRPSGGNGVLLP